MSDPADELDLGDIRSIHVVGIGGAGMMAIASVLSAMGHRVSGSDMKESTGLDRLRSAGIDVTVGHDAALVHPGIDVLAISTAIPERNVEVAEARRLGIPVLRRAAVLGSISRTRRTVAVAGTHGKTTTSSMLALALRGAEMAPSFIIGGELNEIGTGSAWSDGEVFVVEADESDATFLGLSTEVALVTNLEPDHIEHYGSFDRLVDAFDQFVSSADRAVVCHDDVHGLALARRHGALTYGTHPDADYHMADLEVRGDGSRFVLIRDGEQLGELSVPVPGTHNARNATGAAVVALELGAPFPDVAEALARFGGVARRFEFRGAAAGVTFVDDYAHLPTEVEAALEAARAGDWNRVVCVFQPHRYSRTMTLASTFGDAFADADLVVITDVYGSGEAARPGVTGLLVVHAVLDARPWAPVAYLPHRGSLVDYLADELRPGDLCLTLGAGDLTTVPDELVERLAS